jgi:hypothetical protein
MELGRFVTQDKADSGQWFPVEFFGEPADFDLLILGDDSDAVQQYNRQAMKKLKMAISKEKKNKNEEFDDETIDVTLDSNDEAVLVRIAGIRGWKRERDKKGNVISETPEPVTLNGKELKNDIESYTLLITKMKALKEFVLSKARDRTNFLSGPSGN